MPATNVRHPWLLPLSYLLLATGCSTPRGEPRAAQASGPVEALAKLLEERYVSREVGARYAAGLRTGLAAGRYQTSAPAELARTLTAELQAISADLHLRVMPEGTDGPPRMRRAGPPPIEGAAWLADGIATLRLNGFPGDPRSIEEVDRFMAEHATARAIILDARAHHGGGLAEMDTMLPYLYRSPTVLVAMEVAAASADPRPEPSLRAAAAPPGRVRREHVVAPHPKEHRLFDAKVYYLISRETGSAGEHLALALKRTHRATLIGDRTAGANHFGEVVPLGGGLEVFLPVGRTFDPDTGLDWEGTGVTPDVDCPPEHAVEVALQLATKARGS